MAADNNLDGVRLLKCHERRCQGADAHIEGALALALRAGVGLDLGLPRVLEEGPQHIAAARAVKLDALQLREHICASCHHPGRTHQLVQVCLPAHTQDHHSQWHPLASSLKRPSSPPSPRKRSGKTPAPLPTLQALWKRHLYLHALAADSMR